MKTLTITEDGTQTIYHGPLDSYVPPNPFLSDLVATAINDGEATHTDADGCEVTAFIAGESDDLEIEGCY